MKTLITILALTLASPVCAKNAAGSTGAAHQGASHHANAQARKTAPVNRSAAPAPIGSLGIVHIYSYEKDASHCPDGSRRTFVPCNPVAPIVYKPTGKVGGLAPETTAFLASMSSAARYRGELCQIFPEHDAQVACLMRGN
jgi:hypothetical protein